MPIGKSDRITKKKKTIPGQIKLTMKFSRLASDALLSLTIVVFTRSRTSEITINAELSIDAHHRPCSKSLAMLIRDEEIEQIYPNGTLLHDGIYYPIELYWREDNFTYACLCEITNNCVRKCCLSNEVLAGKSKLECVEVTRNRTIPDIALKREQLADEIRNISRLEERFVLVKNGHRCPAGAYKLEPETFPEDQFVLQSNGTLSTGNGILPQWKYCIDVRENLVGLEILVCADPEVPELAVGGIIYPFGIAISVPFLLATLFVYAIIPELKNLYGMTLMCYVGCLVVAYSFLASERFVYSGHPLCVTIAFIIHFSFLSSFFWLNVMCFDIWWTFGGFRSIQGTVKQREKKKFIMYSIYAWGSASLLTGICVIMDFVPSIPRSFIRPEFGTASCFFVSESAKALYFYGPIGITVLCNICLFILTTMKIIQHKKDTAHHLKGMDSQRHDDNKQWFNLYLKLFIVMGINWSMEIISWLCKDSPQYVWYITDLANTLQGVIIFIIFVWKDKTKRLLLKRLGCQNNSFQSRNSTRSGYNSTASRTVTTTAVMTPLQEKINPYPERNKTTTDESDCI